jgi:hypothetical protein
MKKCFTFVSLSLICVEGTLVQIASFTTRVDKERNRVCLKPIARNMQHQY